jgi:hypothetical protein
MATTTPKLSDLSQRIAHREAELAALRQQLETRLADLNRRRDELRNELRTVEAEIEGVPPAGSPPEKPAPTPTGAAKAPTPAPPQPKTASAMSLPEFLLQLVREANGRPMTLAQLQHEVIRRRFPTKTVHIRDMVGARVSDLVKRGRLRRDVQTGGLLLSAPPEASAAPGQPATRQQRRADRTAKAGKGASSSPARLPPAKGESPLSLRAHLLAVLKRAGRTLSAQELSERVQSAGYQSTSADLKEGIWKMMARIPEVERDPKGGYCLKMPKR